MPWIRLSDNYIHDEKFRALSDGAFRLWHEGMSYCRMHQTDGVIPFKILKDFYSFSRKNEKQLATPSREGLAPLWELIPATGYKVHNYLNWNLSKEEEQNERAGSAARMKKFRSRYAVTNAVTNGATNAVSDAFVPVRIGTEREFRSEREPERKPDARSKRPIFSGQRLTVFEWQLDECINSLGPHVDAFALDEWFWSVDAMAVNQGLVIPKRDGGEWLQAQLVAECQRRGLPLKFATASGKNFAQPSDEGVAAILRKQGVIQ